MRPDFFVPPEVSDDIKEIKKLSDEAWSIHQEWVDAEPQRDPEAEVQVLRREPPDQRYRDAMEAWIFGFRPGKFPIAAPAMRQFEGLWYEYRHASNDWTEPKLLSTALLEAMRNAKDYCDRVPPNLAKAPSPEQLHSDGVPKHQICSQHRLFDKHGGPDSFRLQQELDHPGSVLTPEYEAAVMEARLVEEGWPPHTRAESKHDKKPKAPAMA